MSSLQCFYNDASASNLWAFILGHGVRQSGTILSTSNPSSHEPQRTQIIKQGPGAGFLGCVQALPSQLVLAPQGLAPSDWPLAEPTQPQAPLLQKGHLSIKLWEAPGSLPRGLTEPVPGPGISWPPSNARPWGPYLLLLLLEESVGVGLGGGRNPTASRQLGCSEANICVWQDPLTLVTSGQR